MWLARDETGALWLFYDKPVQLYEGSGRWRLPYIKIEEVSEKNVFCHIGKGGTIHNDIVYRTAIELKPTLFMEVQLENSPVELKLNI